MMHRYKNLKGNSGIAAFEAGEDSIKVRFASGDTYLYDTSAPGRTHVTRMKTLAQRGSGLATYIAQQIRDNYARKL